jgi:hypothetical protein
MTLWYLLSNPENARDEWNKRWKSFGWLMSLGDCKRTWVSGGVVVSQENNIYQKHVKTPQSRNLYKRERKQTTNPVRANAEHTLALSLFELLAPICFFALGRVQGGASERRREIRTVMMAFIKYLHPTSSAGAPQAENCCGSPPCKETPTSHIAADWVGDRARSLYVSRHAKRNFGMLCYYLIFSLMYATQRQIDCEGDGARGTRWK